MRARGNLRHNPAKGAVFIQLRENQIGQNLPIPRDHGGGSFIATGFNPKDFHHGFV
jgi:hypothetical protein